MNIDVFCIAIKSYVFIFIKKIYLSRHFLFALLQIVFCPLIVTAQINVLASQTASGLAQKLAGAGVTISNPVLSCPTIANGFFTVTNSNLGLDSGILLTTGRAASSGSSIGVNGNSSLLASNDDGAPGDTSLLALAGQQTYDACNLEFDVIPNGDTISINYVFSSEEYINSVCGPYNDAFAFFISGFGITGADNMALVPGTDIPVTINSINNGVPGKVGTLINCTSMGTGAPFTAYYIDNAAGTTLTHEGFTTVLKAVHAVSPCVQYHFKIVIADAGDPLYDSGVFLEAGSLQSESYTVRAASLPVHDTTAPICIKGCLPGRFRVKSSKISSAPQVVRLATGGAAISGFDYTPIADSVVIPAFDSAADVLIYGLPTPINGTKIIKLYIYSPILCSGVSNIIDSAAMLIYDTLQISVTPSDTFICGSDSILLHAIGDSIYTYHWLPDVKISCDSSQWPIVYSDVNTVYTVTALLPNTACPAKSASVYLLIKLTPYITFFNLDTTVCYNTSFVFSPMVSPPNMYYSYQWSGPDSFTATVPEPLINNAISSNDGNYTLYVKNDTNGCVSSATISVNVNIPDTPMVTSPTIFCLNTQPSALVANGTHILWYDARNDSVYSNPPIISTSDIADYQYYVTQTINNCTSPKSSLLVEVLKCCDGDIFIPTAFSPNGDGKNDIFNIREDYGYTVKELSIYNRWGQVVYCGNIGSWDGSFDHRQAETGTYFYEVIFSCILGGTVERKGDITLIR